MKWFYCGEFTQREKSESVTGGGGGLRLKARSKTLKPHKQRNDHILYPLHITHLSLKGSFIYGRKVLGYFFLIPVTTESSYKKLTNEL